MHVIFSLNCVISTIKVLIDEDIDLKWYTLLIKHNEIVVNCINT